MRTYGGMTEKVGEHLGNTYFTCTRCGCTGQGDCWEWIKLSAGKETRAGEIDEPCVDAINN